MALKAQAMHETHDEGNGENPDTAKSMTGKRVEEKDGN